MSQSEEILVETDKNECNEEDEKKQIEIDFRNSKYMKCDAIDLFNHHQLYFFQCLYIDIRPSKEYKMNHIRSFINIPENSTKGFVINQINNAPIMQLKNTNISIDIYCCSNQDLMDNKQNEKWYKYIHQLLCEEFKEYDFKSFNVLNVEYEIFSNKFPYLITQNEAKLYEEFTMYPSIIIDDRLYCGDEDNAKSKDVIKNLGITHILNITVNVNNIFEYDKELSFIKYLQCKIEDDVYVDINQLFSKCIHFIDNALKENAKNKVLVHCQAGISRSSTIIIAYLMKIKKMSFQNALEFTQKRRQIVCPNIGFQQQLKSLELDHK